MRLRHLSRIAIFVFAMLLPALLPAQVAPGGPGSVPAWTSGGKEGVGTSATLESKVWFTLQGGVMTEVYYPRLDVANVRSLEFAVSDGRSVWLESRDLEHAITWADERALVFRQTSRHPRGLFTLTKTYITDPARATVLVQVTFSTASSAANRYAVYALYDPSLNNTGSGDTGWRENDALVAQDGELASALAASPPFAETANGFVGVNDGRTDLLLHQKLTWSYARAENGNLLQTAKLGSGTSWTLALGFGSSTAEALAGARSSLARGFAAVRADYVRGWSAYLNSLRAVREPYRQQFRMAAMQLKAHEDKTHRGAMIASASIPWGEATPSDKPNIGGYHLVWARDLYHVATAFLAMGDSAAAERALDYLLRVQQRPDGSFPQNSWLDGRSYWPSIQMDEQAFPIILAWQLGHTGKETWEKHLRPAAEFIAKNGPRTPQERWEEEEGYSPATIAAEIAGLVCAAEIARKNDAAGDADRYLKLADEWVANLEKWMVTSTGTLDKKLAASGGGRGYYIRINNNTDPNDGFKLDINNGGGAWDERDVVDAGFLELVRLGIKPPDDPYIVRSLAVVDAVIRAATPNGFGWYRYNHDGYGEKSYGGPWAPDMTGVGRLWPILAGERGEYVLAAGKDPDPYIGAMMAFANRGWMIPEQVWDQAEPTGFRWQFGEGTGSATPLAWSMAQFVRLVVGAEEKRIVEMPGVVAARYLRR